MCTPSDFNIYLTLNLRISAEGCFQNGTQAVLQACRLQHVEAVGLGQQLADKVDGGTDVQREVGVVVVALQLVEFLDCLNILATRIHKGTQITQ